MHTDGRGKQRGNYAAHDYVNNVINQTLKDADQDTFFFRICQ